jgi:GNAT superfamily N-acetyltransferase
MRTNSDDEQFQQLVRQLDADLKIRDGDEHLFYSQFNKIDTIKYAIVAYENELPVGCGAIKVHAAETTEVKRMYVLPGNRKQGIASTILKELELWAVDLNARKLLLETGKNQPEAIALYKKNGYAIIPNFGQYENIENSVCFEKRLGRK